MINEQLLQGRWNEIKGSRFADRPDRGLSPEPQVTDNFARLQNPATLGGEVMALTGGDILVETLIKWGVTTIFGLPGDGINGIIESLPHPARQNPFRPGPARRSRRLYGLRVRQIHRPTGRLPGDFGPGGIHLLNGLYDAKMDGQPVLAIAGEHFHDLLNTHAQQDVDLERDLTRTWPSISARIMGPEHVQNVTDLACRKAITGPGVSCLTFPVDFQSQSPARRSERNLANHTSEVYSHRVSVPADDELRRAAEILNSGQRVAILAGRGASGAGDELEQIADTLAGPIIKPLLGKAVVPDDSPFTTGGIGLLGTRPSQEAIETCDTILMVGTSFPVHGIPSQAGPGAGRPNRQRSGADRVAICRSRWGWSATAV